MCLAIEGREWGVPLINRRKRRIIIRLIGDFRDILDMLEVTIRRDHKEGA